MNGLKGLGRLASVCLSAFLLFASPAYGSEKYFGFFGSADVEHGFSRFNADCLSPASDPNHRQMVRVAPYTNMIMELGWGDWTSRESRQSITDCMTKRLVEARAFGKSMAIATVDYLLFDAQQHWIDGTPFRYRGDDLAVPELKSFFAQLERNSVLDMVARGYCYIVDEPGLYGITAEDMRLAIGAVQEAAAAFPSLGRCKTSVIYDYGRYPGIELVDLAGHDHYDIGVGIVSEEQLQWFKSMLRPLSDPNPQYIMLVAGGAFGEDPEPFYQAMKDDPQIKVFVAFIFFNGWKSLGIYGNGMERAYCMVGKKVMYPSVPEPDCETAPPQTLVSVNNQEKVAVTVGTELCYTWETNSTNLGKRPATSYWWSSNPVCSYGLNGARWAASTAKGSSCWSAYKEQVGCTYTITFAACGGATCSADAISVTVLP